MGTSRRNFLRGVAATVPLAMLPRRSRAAGGLNGRQVAGTGKDFKVLEIFFAGALSHRESFWVEQADEPPVVRRLATLNPQTNALTAPPGAPGDYLAWLPALGAYTSPSYRMGTLSSYDLHLGPCAEPLVRPDANGDRLTARLRVVATGHERNVHEPAQALMLQGTPSITSVSKAAGVGAAIARHTGLPSFVFYDSGLMDSANSALEAAAIGRHLTADPPYLIPYDNPTLIGNLAVPRDAARDALSAIYNADYEAGLTFANAGSPAAGLRARSVSLDRYLDSQSSAFNGQSLAASLGALSASTGQSVWDNGARRAIQASVSLLAAGTSKYCCVVDGGIVGPTNGGFSRYDAHGVASFDDHAAIVTANVLNVLRTLREEIDAGNLDLDDTLVVFNTEYGRNFPLSFGSDHCSRGFAVAMLGGPIASGLSGVVGDLPFTSADDGNPFESGVPGIATGGLAPGPTAPTDLRAAVLLAAGVHPFQTDVFDVPEANVDPLLTPDQAADAIGAHVFGV